MPVTPPAGARTAALLALALVTPLGCDDLRDEETAAVDVTADMTQAWWAAAVGADTIEVVLAVEDLDGDVVSERAIVSAWQSREVSASLTCRRGAAQVLRVTLVGAYEGRPAAPRGGVGGRPLGDAFGGTVPFTCPDTGDVALAWPLEGEEPEVMKQEAKRGFLSVAVTVNGVAEDVQRTLRTDWYLRVTNSAGAVVWQQIVDSVHYGGNGSFSYVGPCDSEPGLEVNQVEVVPLAVYRDGARVDRDGWHLDAVREPFTCLDRLDVAVFAERTLTWRSTDATP